MPQFLTTPATGSKDEQVALFAQTVHERLYPDGRTGGIIDANKAETMLAQAIRETWEAGYNDARDELGAGLNR